MSIVPKIESRLSQIEHEDNVRILYACESGSRIWGFESADSDWDVRFIYKRPVSWYLTVERLYHIRAAPDTIRRPIDSDLIDLEGWDITKVILALYKSNCPIHEWLQSSQKYVYTQEFVDDMLKVSSDAWSIKSAMYHYFSMTKKNVKEYLVDRDTVWSKKYLYILRTLLACLYIEKHKCMPPPSINDLLISAYPPHDIYQEILALIKRKIRGDELGKEQHNKTLNTFIYNEMMRLDAMVIPTLVEPDHHDLLPALNVMLQSYIMENYAIFQPPCK